MLVTHRELRTNNDIRASCSVMLAVHGFVGTQQGRLRLKYLPTCAQELNPVEYLWGYWKHHVLPSEHNYRVISNGHPRLRHQQLV